MPAYTNPAKQYRSYMYGPSVGEYGKAQTYGMRGNLLGPQDVALSQNLLSQHPYGSTFEYGGKTYRVADSSFAGGSPTRNSIEFRDNPDMSDYVSADDIQWNDKQPGILSKIVNNIPAVKIYKKLAGLFSHPDDASVEPNAGGEGGKGMGDAGSPGQSLLDRLHQAMAEGKWSNGVPLIGKYPGQAVQQGSLMNTLTPGPGSYSTLAGPNFGSNWQAQPYDQHGGTGYGGGSWATNPHENEPGELDSNWQPTSHADAVQNSLGLNNKMMSLHDAMVRLGAGAGGSIPSGLVGHALMGMPGIFGRGSIGGGRQMGAFTRKGA